MYYMDDDIASLEQRLQDQDSGSHESNIPSYLFYFKVESHEFWYAKRARGLPQPVDANYRS